MDRFLSTLESVEKVLCDSKIPNMDADAILLFGGSNEIPKVQQSLTDFFNGKKLCKNINPYGSGAYAATIQASVFVGNTSENAQELYRKGVPIWWWSYLARWHGRYARHESNWLRRRRRGCGDFLGWLFIFDNRTRFWKS